MSTLEEAARAYAEAKTALDIATKNESETFEAHEAAKTSNNEALRAMSAASKALADAALEPKEPAPIQIGSTVKISDNPKCTEDGEATGWVDPDFAGKTGTVYSGPNDDGDWRVQTGDKSYNRQTISPKHLTVVSA